MSVGHGFVEFKLGDVCRMPVPYQLRTAPWFAGRMLTFNGETENPVTFNAGTWDAVTFHVVGVVAVVTLSGVISTWSTTAKSEYQ